MTDRYAHVERLIIISLLCNLLARSGSGSWTWYALTLVVAGAAATEFYYAWRQR